METISALAKARLDALAKPQGSLGTMERLVVRLCETQASLTPKTKPRRILLFAADHGVVEAGVGLWPQAVTAAMINTIAAGKATSAVWARTFGSSLTVVDVGSKIDPAPTAANYCDWRGDRRGTANMALAPALTVSEFNACWQQGARAIDQARADGMALVAIGEMGIGNTTAAAATIAFLTNSSSDHVTGDGAGATDATRKTKHSIVTQAVARAAAMPDRQDAIASLCGFELVAMAGAIARAAETQLTVVLDGVVVAAAALIADAITPGATRTAIASHVGSEPGHRIALEHLGLSPFLDWQLRLGEGSGALLLLPMLDAAAALMTDVATLAELQP